MGLCKRINHANIWRTTSNGNSEGNTKEARVAGAEWASKERQPGARLHDILRSIQRIWDFISNVMSRRVL